MFQPDVIVIGGGLIGLACATAVAHEGFRVHVMSAHERGAASPASAGILAPRVGQASPAARTLGTLSRDLYPEWLHSLEQRTGLAVPLTRSGVLEVAFDDAEAAALRAAIAAGSDWLDGSALRALEPVLAPAVGAALHPHDGAVDVPALLSALQVDVARDHRIAVVDARVSRIAPGQGSIAVELEGGGTASAQHVILAAGAWAGCIAGLPRSIPVTPARGQIVSFPSIGLDHVAIASRGYLVSRHGRTLVGSTVEHVGFDARTTADAAAILHQCAGALAPMLAGATPLDHTAGLRPMTPDLLPIVGRDPDHPGLIYACGHSKNGVLLAPLTAQAVADCVAGRPPRVDLSAYAPERFA